LKTKFHPSPYIVIRPLWTTTLVRRLSDGFTTLYSNDDLKKYDRTSPLFSNLPKEITRVLLHSFQDLIDSDLAIITQHDPLTVPQGIQLFNPLEKDDNFDDKEEDQEPDNLPEKDKLDFPEIPDEFEPMPIPEKQVEKVQEQEERQEDIQNPLDIPDTGKKVIIPSNQPDRIDEEDLDEDDRNYINQALVDHTTQELQDFPKNINEQPDLELENEVENDPEIEENIAPASSLRRGSRIRKPKVRFQE